MTFQQGWDFAGLAFIDSYSRTGVARHLAPALRAGDTWWEWDIPGGRGGGGGAEIRAHSEVPWGQVLATLTCPLWTTPRPGSRWHLGRTYYGKATRVSSPGTGFLNAIRPLQTSGGIKVGPN